MPTLMVTMVTLHAHWLHLYEVINHFLAMMMMTQISYPKYHVNVNQQATNNRYINIVIGNGSIYCYVADARIECAVLINIVI
jgi:hypothetical protein